MLPGKLAVSNNKKKKKAGENHLVFDPFVQAVYNQLYTRIVRFAY